jgi:Zn-dependent protease
LAGIDLADVFVKFVVLLLSLTVHEAAHALTADRLGDPTARLLGRVSLNPAVHVDPIGTLLFPLIALLTNVHGTRVGQAGARQHHTPAWSLKRKFMLIAAAGPASNVVLAIVASLLLHVVPVTGRLEEATLAPLAQFLYQAVLLNVLLAVFNMVPVPPLDGGNVLAGVLRGPIAESYERLRPYGFMILYGLMFTGILTMIIAPPANFLLDWLL